MLDGEKTEEEILLEFLDTLGDSGCAGNRDGCVSIEEFEANLYPKTRAKIELHGSNFRRLHQG